MIADNKRPICLFFYLSILLIVFGHRALVSFARFSRITLTFKLFIYYGAYYNNFREFTKKWEFFLHPVRSPRIFDFCLHFYSFDNSVQFLSVGRRYTILRRVLPLQCFHRYFISGIFVIVLILRNVQLI